MQSLILTFRNIERSGAVEARIREMSERLRRCHDRITYCHVTVLGGLNEAVGTVAVKIHLSVPGAQVHADSVNPDGDRHTDVFLALRDAYDSARRQLRDLQRDGRRSSLVSVTGGSTSR